MTFAKTLHEKGNTPFVIKGVGLALFGLFVMISACHRVLPSTAFKNTPIAIGVFENKTPEPILEDALVSTFHEAWIRRHLVLVSHPEKAAFVLTGTIDQITETPRSLNREGRGVAHRITIGVTYHLASQNNEPPLTWNDTAHADWFTRTADLPYDQSERHRAIRQAFVALSGKAAHRVTEMIATQRQAPSKT